MTTGAGTPLADNQNSQTAGPRGPVLMQDYQLMEKMAHFNRERVPERVVHAKGAGAYGTFTVTGDISRYTRANCSPKSVIPARCSAVFQPWQERWVPPIRRVIRAGSR